MLGKTNTKSENCFAQRRRHLGSLQKKKTKLMGSYMEDFLNNEY